jgi:hypothetical protein
LCRAPPNQPIGKAEHEKIIDAEHALCVESVSCGDLFGSNAHSDPFCRAPISRRASCGKNSFIARATEKRN